jgi:excisionase family DNA binding protein
LSVTSFRGRRHDERPPRLLPMLDSLPVIGISKSTAYRLLHAGEFPIPAIQIGRRWFVRSVDLDALVARAS